MNEESYPLLSIIIAVYKAERTLLRCLDSIFSQISADGDGGVVEVLAVDDASPDGSGTILAKYRNAHPALKIATHAANQREAGTRNTGVAETRGTYFTFLDPDDAYAPGAVARMISAIRLHHPDLIHYCYARLAPDGTRLSRTHLRLPGFHSIGTDNQEILRALFQDTAFGIMTSGGVYRRAVAPELRFSADFPISPDRHFGWEFFRRCSNVFQIDEAIYEYYQYPNTLSRERTVPAVEGLLRLDRIFWTEFRGHPQFSAAARFGFRRLFPGVVGWHFDLVFGRNGKKRELADLYFDVLATYLDGKTANSELGLGRRWLRLAAAWRFPAMVKLYRTLWFRVWLPVKVRLGMRKL